MRASGLLGICSLIIDIRNEKKGTKKHGRCYVPILFPCIFVALSVCLFCWKALPVIRDVRGENIVAVSGICERKDKGSSRKRILDRILDDETVLVTVNGETWELVMPPLAPNKEDFPIGAVWYAPESRILLAVEAESQKPRRVSVVFCVPGQTRKEERVCRRHNGDWEGGTSRFCKNFTKE